MLNKYLPKVTGKVKSASKFNASEFFKENGVTQGKLPDKAILVFSTRLFEILEKELHLEETDFPYNGHFKEGINRKDGVLVVMTFAGGPLAGIMVEELSIWGVKEFLILGTAGSLSPDVHFNDLVLCTGAVRDEGTSYHYLPPSLYAYPSKELLSGLDSFFEKSGIPASRGPTWTTDAPYMETVDEIREYRKMGILTVEMEAASVFAVTQVKKLQSAAVFSVSDELHGEKWTGMKTPEKGFEGLKRVASHFVQM